MGEEEVQGDACDRWLSCNVPFLDLVVILRVNHWRQDGTGESIRYAECVMHVCCL